MLNKKFFITGATGSFGTEFIRYILRTYKPKKVTIFSKDELKQHNFKNYSFIKNTKSKVRFLLGDIRDKERLDFAISDQPDYVIHAASLKQLDTAEYNPSEFIKTNIIGAENLISACLKYKIPKVLALSTDKASSPINLYGGTQLVSDKLFISANNYSRFTKLSIVRYGDVDFSRSLILTKLINQSKKNVFTLTDPGMTRFSINLKNSTIFVSKILKKMQGGEIFVPKLKSYRLIDLIKAINKNAKIKYIGFRSGEKLHEEMISETESKDTVEYKDSFVIYPQLTKKKINKKIVNGYRSDVNEFLKISEIKEIIKKKIESKTDKIINYSMQNIDSDDIKKVSLALNDDYITQGKRVVKFENDLSKFFKSRYSLAVANGTAGLYLSLKSLSLKKKDKVIISPFTFLAAANCCKLLNLTEKFIDIDKKNLNINLDLLEKELKKKIYKAVIVTDFGGLPADWHRLNYLKKKYNIYLINDNCHALGSKFKGDFGYAVKFADLVVQSFHPVKHITTGEGGSILTNNNKLYNKIKNLRSLGIIKDTKKYWEYDLTEPSLNFRISDIQCALGSSQILKVKNRIEEKRIIAKKYDAFFSKYDYFEIPLDNKDYYNSYHLYPLRIDFKKLKKTKTQLMNYFFKNKVRLQVHYIPTYKMKIFKNWDKKNFPICEEVFNNIVSIPIFYNLKNEQVDKVTTLFKDFFNLK